MNRIYLAFVIISLVMTAPAYVHAAPAPSDNLLLHPNFDTGKLHEWDKSGVIAGTGIGLTLEQYKSPDYSAKFVATTNTNDTSLRLHQDFDVIGGTTYLGSALLFEP